MQISLLTLNRDICIFNTGTLYLYFNVNMCIKWVKIPNAHRKCIDISVFKIQISILPEDISLFLIKYRSLY